MLPKNWTKKEGLCFILFLVICYFPIFHHLGIPPIKGWDEGLFAMRALHLYDTGEYLSSFTVFPGEIDHDNAKPPFFTCLQALSLAVFADLELALRLPIALCVLGTVLTLLLYAKRKSGHFWWGMMASLILMTSEGYTRVHVAKTADHDAGLAFLMLLQCFTFLAFLNANNKKSKLIFAALFSLLLFCSFLTKSVVGFLFLPGFVIYLILQKKLMVTLKQPIIYAAITAVVIGVGGYYFWLQQNMPEILAAIRTDSFGRFLGEVKSNQNPFDFYLKRYWNSSFRLWVYFVPLGVALAFSNKLKQFQPITQLAVCCLIPYLLIISISVTKLPWYDAALYPLLSIIVATALYQLGGALLEWTEKSVYFPNSSVVLYSMIFLFLLPYIRIVKQFNNYQLSNPNEQYAYLMKRIDRQNEVKNYIILTKGPFPQPAFYAGYFNRLKGYKIQMTDDVEDCKAGEIVLFCQTTIKARVDTLFSYTPLENYKDKCHLLRIDGQLKK